MTSKDLLEGKTAVITGCSRGIGYALVQVFLQHGADVIPVVRTRSGELFDNYENLKKSGSGQIVDEVICDLTNADSVKNAVREINSSRRAIDIVVNNAGAIKTAPIFLTSESDLDEMLRVNLLSQIALVQGLSRRMLKNGGGSIINVSSTAALDGNGGRLAYSSSKAGLIAASKVMSKELGRYNIRVNVIAPGLTDTAMMWDSTDEQEVEAVVGNLSLGRIGQTSEIASVALFLASDLSSYVTGQIIRVDGGM